MKVIVLVSASNEMYGDRVESGTSTVADAMSNVPAVALGNVQLVDV